MKYLLVIQGENCSAILERLFRVCRILGFTIQNLNAETTENEKSFHVTITVYGDSSISLLTKKLNKIYGVAQVVTFAQGGTSKPIARAV